jgi:hypothetical protein
VRRQAGREGGREGGTRTYLALHHQVAVLASWDLVIVDACGAALHPALERRVHLADLRKESEGGREEGRVDEGLAEL